MKWRLYLVGTFCLFTLLLIAANIRTWSSAKIVLPQQKVIVQLGQAKVVAEVASTPEQKERGLGGRTSLGQNQGMLFPFPEANAPAFWMRGMLMSIDIIWIYQGQVIGVAERVPPPAPGTNLADLPLYAPPGQADAVLEVNAGWAEAHGVGVGSVAQVTSYL